MSNVDSQRTRHRVRLSAARLPEHEEGGDATPLAQGAARYPTLSRGAPAMRTCTVTAEQKSVMYNDRVTLWIVDSTVVVRDTG